MARVSFKWRKPAIKFSRKRSGGGFYLLPDFYQNEELGGFMGTDIFEKCRKSQEHFINSHVNRYLSKSNSIYDRDDLIQEALIVLWKCSLNIRYSSSQSFERIFRKSFRNRMIDIIRKAKRSRVTISLEFLNDIQDTKQEDNNTIVNHLLEKLKGDFIARMFVTLHAIGCTKKEVKKMLSLGSWQYYSMRYKIFSLVK